MRGPSPATLAKLARLAVWARRVELIMVLVLIAVVGAGLVHGELFGWLILAGGLDVLALTWVHGGLRSRQLIAELRLPPPPFPGPFPHACAVCNHNHFTACQGQRPGALPCTCRRPHDCTGPHPEYRRGAAREADRQELAQAYRAKAGGPIEIIPLEPKAPLVDGIPPRLYHRARSVAADAITGEVDPVTSCARIRIMIDMLEPYWEAPAHGWLVDRLKEAHESAEPRARHWGDTVEVSEFGNPPGWGPYIRTGPGMGRTLIEPIE